MRAAAKVFNRRTALHVGTFGGGLALSCCFQQGLTLTQRPPEDAELAPEPAAGDVVGYDHNNLINDLTRVRPYAAAIAAESPGRRVLDIGTGPVCLLARLCLRSGAASVDAVEYSKAAVSNAIRTFHAEGALATGEPSADERRWLVPGEAALAVARVEEAPGHDGGCRAKVDVADGGAVQRLTLYEGLSTDPAVALPGGYTMVVHELLGDQAGVEGAAKVVADIHARGLAAEGCVFVPRSASTMVAPTMELRRTILERLVHRLGHGGSARIEPRVRHQALRFNRGALLAEPQPLEVLDFQHGPALRQDRLLEFETECDGGFDGFHMHLQVDLDGREEIDVLQLHNTKANNLCSWSTVYVRLLDEPIWLPAGSRIAMRCRSDLSQAVLGELQTSTSLTSYTLDVAIGPKGNESDVATFSWRGG